MLESAAHEQHAHKTRRKLSLWHSVADLKAWLANIVIGSMDEYNEHSIECAHFRVKLSAQAPFERFFYPPRWRI
jgi:hypothetical protein